jgi:hypothetical protein
MSHENGTPPKTQSIRPKPAEQQITVSVAADKKQGLVRIAFSSPIGWFDLDALACVNMIRVLGEKLRELQN